MEPTLVKDRDGLEVTVVGGIGYAVLPKRNGKFVVANDFVDAARLPNQSFGGMTVTFHDDEASAKADLADLMESERQKSGLGRHAVPYRDVTTPWGKPDSARAYGEGVTLYGTPSHGGFKLDATRNAAVAAPLRAKGGFYEEDCEWAAVAYAFPRLFTDRERRSAIRTLKDWKPDEYAKATGEEVLPRESRILRERAFHAANAQNFVVVSALGRGDVVDCVATLGGRRDASATERKFVVPRDEYAIGEFGFVIDESRHEEAAEAAPGM